MTPELTLVVAHADNRVIGRDNRLPWHLPADLKHFKAVTFGKPVVMGRRTWESIGRALPGRLNIVVSSRDLDGHSPNGNCGSRDDNSGNQDDNCGSRSVIGDLVVVPSLDAAIAAAGTAPEVCVIGGARLFAEALPRAVRIHLTEVHAEIDGDVYFPLLEPGAWREVSREFRAADERNAYPMSLVVLERRSAH